MTSRIPPLDPTNAPENVKELFAGVTKRIGSVPNMMKEMARSPAVIGGYLALDNSLSNARLTPRQREQIALAVAEANQCQYCVSTHSAIAKLVGLNPDQVEKSRLGMDSDPASDALIRFALTVLETRGHITDTEVDDVRAAGFEDEVIAEVVANVALNVLTNYFNSVAATELDFPPAPALGKRPVPSY